MRKPTYFRLLGLILAACSLAALAACSSAPAETVPSVAEQPTAEPVTEPTAEPTGPFKLEGKTFLFLGSSVTYGSASNGWAMGEYLMENENCRAIKLAVSGTTLVTSSANSYVARLKQYVKQQRLKECDHVIVQLSTNDATQNKPLGAVSDSKSKEDFDTETIIGAVEYIIALSQETWGCRVSFYTGTKYESAAYAQMVEALPAVAEKWDIGILDLYNDPEMNAVSAEDYAKYMNDPIHPNKLGYEQWWGPKFKEYLEQFP